MSTAFGPQLLQKECLGYAEYALSRIAEARSQGQPCNDSSSLLVFSCLLRACNEAVGVTCDCA